MIFICFSGEERYSIVKNIIYHLGNFKIDYWYDNYNLLLGDVKRKEIIENGIYKSDYAIIIYSDSFFKHPSCVEEEQIILDLHKNNKIQIFPILYNITFKDLPINTKTYLENIIYNEIYDSSNIYLTLNQIFVRILKDKYRLIQNRKFKFNNDYLKKVDDVFIKKELEFFLNINEQELNYKIITLKIIFDYLYYNKKVINNKDLEYKMFTYLIKKINYNLSYDFKEIELMSLIIYYYAIFLKIHKLTL